MLLNKILEVYSENSFLVADDFDEGVIGLEEKTQRLVYSVSKCINILISNQGLSEEEAIEYFEFNVKNAYVGDLTPIWCEDYF